MRYPAMSFVVILLAMLCGDTRADPAPATQPAGQDPNARVYGFSPTFLPLLHMPGPSQKIVYASTLSTSMIGRLPTLKKQLTAAVNHLKPVSSFDCVFIHGKMFDSFSKYARSEGLVPATQESKAAAGKFLDTITAAGPVADPTKALEAIFKSKPDFVFFFTDGDFADNDAVIKKIRELNQDRKVRIVAYLFVDGGPRNASIVETMQTIARENSGILKTVKDSDIEEPTTKPSL